MSTPVIGLSHFYYAKVTADTSSTITYGTPVRVKNVTQANISFNSVDETFFADNGAAITYVQMGEIEASINVADLTSEQYAELLGFKHTTQGVIEADVDATPIDVAIGFKVMKTDGSYRYIWLMKGKFAVPEANAQTKEASVNFQQQELTWKGVQRVNDGLIMRRVDSNDEKLPEGVTATVLDAKWFENPDYVPATPTT